MKKVISKLDLNPRHSTTSIGIQKQRPVQSKASAPAKEVGIVPILQRMKHSTIRRRFLCFDSHFHTWLIVLEDNKVLEVYLK